MSVVAEEHRHLREDVTTEYRLPIGSVLPPNHDLSHSFSTSHYVQGRVFSLEAASLESKTDEATQEADPTPVSTSSDEATEVGCGQSQANCGNFTPAEDGIQGNCGNFTPAEDGIQGNCGDFTPAEERIQGNCGDFTPAEAWIRRLRHQGKISEEQRHASARQRCHQEDIEALDSARESGRPQSTAFEDGH